MEELRFASENEAVQYLADITGNKIYIAQINPSYGTDKMETFITNEDLEQNDPNFEPDVIVEYEWQKEEAPSLESPGQPSEINIISVVRKHDQEEVLDQLSKKQIKELEQKVIDSLPSKEDEEAEQADYLIDKSKEEK